MLAAADLFYYTPYVVLLGISYYVVKSLASSLWRPDLPGPGWELPFLGHLYLLGEKPHLGLTKLQKRHGDIFALKLGPIPAVAICGKDTIKEAGSKAMLMGRPHKYFNSWRKHERYFAFGHDATCLRYRKIVMKALSDFTKDRLKEKMEKESDALISNLCDSNTALDHQTLVCKSISNLAYFLCYGRVSQQSNEEFEKTMACIDDILNFAKHAGIADTFPWATCIPSVNRLFKRFEKAQDDLITVVKQQEKRHLDLKVGSENQQDLCDLLQKQMDESDLKEQSSKVGTAVEQTGMLLVAGTETVSTTLNWALLLLAAHQELQEDIYQEISTNTTKRDEKIGPKLEAFFLETLRFSMASPLSMPHMALDDVELKGLLIRKDSIILLNLWSGSRDERTWGDDANKFNPHRFLDVNGQVNQELSTEVVAFGSGRRRCAGEVLARTELLHFIKKIIKSCEIHLQMQANSIDYWSNADARNKAPLLPIKFYRRDRS